jgi:hypothetical protein
MVLGQFLMEVKAGVVLPVFDPQTINLQITNKQVDDEDKFDKEADAQAITVDPKFPMVPNNDFVNQVVETELAESATE